MWLEKVSVNVQHSWNSMAENNISSARIILWPKQHAVVSEPDHLYLEVLGPTSQNLKHVPSLHVGFLKICLENENKVVLNPRSTQIVVLEGLSKKTAICQ